MLRASTWDWAIRSRNCFSAVVPLDLRKALSRSRSASRRAWRFASGPAGLARAAFSPVGESLGSERPSYWSVSPPTATGSFWMVPSVGASDFAQSETSISWRLMAPINFKTLPSLV